MRFFSLIWLSIVSLIQYGTIIAIYWLCSLALYYLVSPYMPGYYEDAGLRDTQAFFTTFLIWDRFFGPYSSLLRGVAKYLNAAKSNQRED